jgi:diguanylate cyclase (GGDEF)-like protein
MPGLVRRTWALIAAAALLPMLGIAWLAASRAEALLLAQSRLRTADAAQRQSDAAWARLQTTSTILRELTRQLESGRGAAGLPPDAPRAFASVGVLRDAGVLRVLHGRRPDAPVPSPPMLSREDRARLRAGDELLRVIAQPGQPGRVFLLREPGGVAPAGDVLAAELDAAFLWGDSASGGESALQRCVMSARGTAVNCMGGAPPAELLRDALARSPSGALDWRQGDHALLGGYRVLPLAQADRGEDWVVIAAERRDRVLSAALPLWRALALALVAAVALAISLAALHAHLARRSLRALIETARHAANGAGEAWARPARGPGAADARAADAGAVDTGAVDAGAADPDPAVPGPGDRVAPDPGSAESCAADPDLAELCAELGNLAAELRLERRIRGALAELERRMLDGVDLDALSRDVVGHLRAVFRAQAVALVLRGQSAARTARLYLAGPADGGVTQASSVPFDPWVGEQRLLGSAGIWLRAPLPDNPVSALLAGQGAQQVLVVPVVHTRALVGLLLVGFARDAAPPARVAEHLAQFAGRVALALAAVARERALLYRSRFDALTGLPNRQSFVERLRYECERAQREGSMLAVVLVNLDHFKTVNDSLGHAGGDDVIRQAAIRLRQSARGVDTVARVGGDEFALLLPGLAAASEAGRLAAQLMRSMSTPFLTGEHERVLTASVGVAVYPVDALGAELLMRDADTALHRAKEAGGGRVVFFEARMNQEVSRRVTLERELRRAIERDEFVLHYQPQMDVRSGMLSGAEVLIRWQHPERKLLAPGAFIDVAEQTGLIEPIGELVLRKACAQLQAWRGELSAPPRLSVNVSGRQFRRRDFAALVASILRESGVDATQLELEITETVLMEDADAASVVLDQLATLGIRLAIDDFGTGYSSLAYLKRLRFDALKIDRSFVKDVTTDEDSAAIASAIIALARTLRKETVAEGVETQEQLEFLRGEQCDLIQGFLISRPVPAEQFVAALGRSISRTRSALRLAASR